MLWPRCLLPSLLLHTQALQVVNMAAFSAKVDQAIYLVNMSVRRPLRNGACECQRVFQGYRLLQERIIEPTLFQDEHGALFHLEISGPGKWFDHLVRLAALSSTLVRPLYVGHRIVPGSFLDPRHLPVKAIMVRKRESKNC
jgi:hypothetical protein